MLLEVKVKRKIEPQIIIIWRKYVKNYGRSNHNNIYHTLIKTEKLFVHLIYWTCNESTCEDTPGFYYTLAQNCYFSGLTLLFFIWSFILLKGAQFVLYVFWVCFFFFKIWIDSAFSSILSCELIKIRLLI